MTISQVKRSFLVSQGGAESSRVEAPQREFQSSATSSTRTRNMIGARWKFHTSNGNGSLHRVHPKYDEQIGKRIVDRDILLRVSFWECSDWVAVPQQFSTQIIGGVVVSPIVRSCLAQVFCALLKSNAMSLIVCSVLTKCSALFSCPMQGYSSCVVVLTKVLHYSHVHRKVTHRP